MVNIITKLNKGEKVTKIPDALFHVDYAKYKEYCNNNELAKKLLREIDGVNYIDGDIIKTKFGATILENISSGSKAAIIVMIDPSIIVESFELGANVIKFLAKIPGKVFKIYTENGILGFNDSDTGYLVNGVMCRSGAEVISKMSKELRNKDR